MSISNNNQSRSLSGSDSSISLLEANFSSIYKIRLPASKNTAKRSLPSAIQHIPAVKSPETSNKIKRPVSARKPEREATFSEILPNPVLQDVFDRFSNEFTVTCSKLQLQDDEETRSRYADFLTDKFLCQELVCICS